MLFLQKKNQTVDSYDNIGDNCYYLGFLFTLISLAIGLYSFDPNEFQSILKITNNFALAIISTLIGLFLRVLFNQIKNESLDESGELEKVIEKTSTDISTEGKKVSEQLSNLSNSINEITIDWKNSSVAIKQKFEEMVDDFSSNTSKTLNEHTNSVNTHFEEMQNKFSTTFTSMLEKTESTNRTAWSQIETTINSIKSNSDSLLNVIKSMETGNNKYK